MTTMTASLANSGPVSTPTPGASGVPAQALTAGAATVDRIRSVKLSSITLPLATPISDAKVFTGRQKPMTEVAFLFAEITTEDGHEGVGFSYSKRAGGPGQFAHAKEIAPVLIGEDPSDIGKIWTKLVWAGASVGPQRPVHPGDRRLRRRPVGPQGQARQPAAGQAARLRTATRFAPTTPPAGSCTPRSSRSRRTRATALASGIGGIKIKVGLPDWKTDIARVERIREHLGDDVPMMVDANQQWDRATAQRMGRLLEQYNLVWIEEPLDAYDAEGHANLPARWTPRSRPARCWPASPNTPG